MPLLLISILFSCGKTPEYYNELYFKGKQEKNEKLLQKGFEKADPYFSQLCATELCDLLPKQKALEIARKKMKDLNTTDEEAAVRMIAGTARNMGITVEGLDQKKDAKAAEPVKASTEKEGK